jgi:predicted RNase H-like nuclease (RuvC/YqgF family)
VNDREATARAPRQNEGQDSLLESYLHGLSEHRNNLYEYLRELGREREELERERGDLDLKIEANEEKRERVTGWIEEIPQLRDKALRSLVQGIEES